MTLLSLNNCEKTSEIAWTTENFPFARWSLLSLAQRAARNFRVSDHTSCCARRSLISYSSLVHTGSSSLAPLLLPHATTAPPGPRAPPQQARRCLNILRKSVPVRGGSRSQSLLLSSYRTALPNERKKLIQTSRFLVDTHVGPKA